MNVIETAIPGVPIIEPKLQLDRLLPGSGQT
jgi:hypothetical protein